MIKKPLFVSFAGIDDKTNIEDLRRLSALYPIAWGVLRGNKQSSRYPSEETIGKFADVSRELHIWLHLCGDYAREFNSLGYLAYPDSSFDSIIQVNLKSDEYDFDVLGGSSRSVVVQSRTPEFTYHGDNIINLHDCSGGLGVVPDVVPKVPYYENNLVGYAGGITPDNVEEWLKKIEPENSQGPVGDYYIDMESGVRTDGWFDVRKCEEVCIKIWGKYV